MEEDTPNFEVRQPAKKSKLGWNILTILPILLVVGALGGFAYLQFNDLQNANKEKDALKSQVSSAQAEIDNLKKQAGNTTNNASEDNVTDLDSDNEEIISTAVAYVHAENGNESKEVTVAIDKKELPFARAQVSVSGGSGYACVFKKVASSWLRLYCAQGQSDYTIQQDELYGVPDSIIKS